MSESASTLTSERVVILVAAIALALFLILTELVPDFGRGGPSGFEVGKTVPVRITLVTADAYDLACASDTAVGDARCAFAKDGAPSSGLSAGTSILAPYMTTDNLLLLIPDLWSEPALARRLAREKPEGKSRDELERFSAACQLTIREKVEDFYVRWVPTAGWSPRSEAWAGTIADCHIE